MTISNATQPIRWHACAPKQLADRLETDLQVGLTPTEVRRRLADHGFNELPQADGISPWWIYSRNFPA